MEPPPKLFDVAIVEIQAKQSICGAHVAVNLPILGSAIPPKQKSATLKKNLHQFINCTV
jgi:hypothetical protein